MVEFIREEYNCNPEAPWIKGIFNDDPKFKRARLTVLSSLESAGKIPLFLILSGSHQWNLCRPDSDIDIFGVYLEPTRNFLGLSFPKDTFERRLEEEDIIDIQVYEFGKFLRMLVKGNGNMIHILKSPSVIYRFPDIDWDNLADKFITKSLRLYYRGYAEAQRKRAMSERGGKALVYTYREIFEGMHVMVTGKLEYDFYKLWDWVIENGYYDKGLLDIYFPAVVLGVKKEVTDEGWRQFYAEWEVLCNKLDEVAEGSLLPESIDHSSREELDNLLIHWRYQGLKISV